MIRSIGKHDGKLHGAKWVQIDDAHALAFDGKSAYVDCGDGARIALRDKLTISAWIYPKGAASSDALVVGEGWNFWAITHHKGNAYFYISSGSNYCHSAVPFHQWSHVAGTYDGTTMRLYVNGALLSTRGLRQGTKIKSAGRFVIGGHGRGDEDYECAYYNGLIADVRVYRDALSDKEIMALAAVMPVSGEEKLTISPGARKAARQFFREHPEAVDFRRSGRRMWLANRRIAIEILQEEKGFYLTRLYGTHADEDFLTEPGARSQAVLWQLMLRRDKGRDKTEIAVNSGSGAKLSSTVARQASGVTLRLRWDGLAVADEANALDVEVSVTLKAGDPLSRWRINVTNRSKTYGLWDVVFPILKLRPVRGEPEKNFLTIPSNRGILAAEPFSSLPSSGGEYPYHQRLMQFNSLYHESGAGLYIAVHDGDGHMKFFGLTPYPAMPALEYRVSHYPRNRGFPAEDYRMTYDVCVGPFKGGWYDACQVYREWALKQRWCSKGPLAVRDDVPRWYKEAPVMLRTGTYSREGLVKRSRDRMLDYLRFFEAELPVTWYGWKKDFPEMTHYNVEGSPWRVPEKRSKPCGNIHDGNYPYLPALASFSSACKAISEAGGHVMPYVCASIYDPGLNENAPLVAQAKPNAVRDLDGKLKVAEAGRVAWTMCYHTKWWQERMAETAAELVKREHASGIYFDTFYGGRNFHPCFHSAHGHSHSGGNGPYLGTRKLALAVRKAMKQAKPDSVMTAEEPAETAIDLLDGILYVHGTIEPDTVPLFATVYGDYICREGKRLAACDKGDIFYISCAALFTEGAQMGRLLVHDTDHYLKDFDAGSKYTEKMRFVRKLARYWKPEVGGRYLAYGQLLRPIEFKQPRPMPTASFVETWRYRRRFDVPVLQSGVFKAPDGSLGVFLANASAEPIQFSFSLTPECYPISEGGTYRITRIGESGKHGDTRTQRGKVSCVSEIAGHDAVFFKVQQMK